MIASRRPRAEIGARAQVQQRVLHDAAQLSSIHPVSHRIEKEAGVGESNI